METIQKTARKPCKRGHLGPRRPNGNCIQCEKDRYHSNPNRKEYTKRKSAERRTAIKADPDKYAKHKAYMKKYAQDNRKKLNQTNSILYYKNKIKILLQRKKIIITDEIVSFIENHSGNCDLCGALGDGKWDSLCIDHCHKTNQFRGMLCNLCNKGIGLLRDDEELLRKAARYVEHYK